MQKIIAIFLIIMECLSLAPKVFAETISSRKFIVTAYYSPLPDQSFYLKWSYEADMRLNWNGTHGASGKEVYPGMLAAPKSYPFGTKIYLGGVGVATVDDRGGAIVSSWSRWYDADRLDIWMGEGEEWLKRALTWGKRTVPGKVISKTEADYYDPIALEQFYSGKIEGLASSLQKNIKKENNANVIANQPSVDIFSIAIKPESSADDIKKLQSVLKDLSYFTWEADGKYTKILEDAIYDFQLENKLVTSPKNPGAGFYGAKTRSQMKEVYARYRENERQKKAEESRLALEKKQQLEKEQIIRSNAREEVSLFVASLGAPKDQETGAHVRNLQKTLITLGYFEGKDTAIFGKNTKEALIQYQKNRKIIDSPGQDDAGIIWKKTRIALVEDLVEQRLKESQSIH